MIASLKNSDIIFFKWVCLLQTPCKYFIHTQRIMFLHTTRLYCSYCLVIFTKYLWIAQCTFLYFIRHILLVVWTLFIYYLVAFTRLYVWSYKIYRILMNSTKHVFQYYKTYLMGCLGCIYIISFNIHTLIFFVL